MKKLSLLLSLLPMLLACAQGPTQAVSALDPDFETEFERLFLSQEPLRYQDNVAFLESILEAELDPEDRERARVKLKEFLTAEPQPRPYAPDSLHTGVASEIAFLRLQALQVLAEIGAQEDADFIRNLKKSEEEHPLFDEECQQAIEKLEHK
jgi:hypothetical protein